MQKAAASLFAKTVAVAADGDDVAVVKQPIEDRGSHDGVAEDRAPFADRAIRGHQHRPALVASRHELEEQMRGIWLEGQIAEFIDDQQLRLGEVGQLFLEPAIGVGLGQGATSAGAVMNRTE